MHRLPHHRDRIVAAGRARRDQQHRGLVGIARWRDIEVFGDRDTRGRDAVGRNAERHQLHARLLPGHKQRVERARKPQALEVVVRGHDSGPRVSHAAKDQRRQELGWQEMRAYNRGRSELLDRTDDRNSVRPCPRVDWAAAPERRVAHVITPVNQPGQALDQHEVAFPQQCAVEHATHLQHVQNLYLGDVGAPGALLLHRRRGAVVTRSHPCGQDQYAFPSFGVGPSC